MAHVRVMTELRSMLSLGPKGSWKPPILSRWPRSRRASLSCGRRVLAHRHHLESSGRATELAQQRLRDETAEVAAEIARDRVRQALAEDPVLAARLLDEARRTVRRRRY